MSVGEVPPSAAPPSPAAGESSTITHVVVLIHGISTQAEWEERVKSVLGRLPGVRIIPLRYEYFDVVRFLVPMEITRSGPKRRIRDQLLDIQRQKEYEDAAISVLAHSFGTYIISELLRVERKVRLSRLVLVGSVVSLDFKWNDLAGHCGQILNDCGWRDYWPVLAESSTWGYGASGTVGFGHNRVVDRFHDARHSDLLSEEAARKYWLPFFSRGEVVDGDTGRPTTPWAVSILTVIHIKYVVIAALLFLGAGMLWWR